MVGRADFDPAEWRAVQQAPTYAGLIVCGAQRGGFFWEAVSIAHTFAEAGARHGGNRLVHDVATAGPIVERLHFESPDDLRAHGLEHLRRAIGIIEQKGSAADAYAFALFVVDVAEGVARAYRETDGPVSAAETAAMADVRAALGLGPSA